MKQFLKNRLIFILLTILSFAVIVPLIIFIFNFYSQDVSIKISDWGAFGDFLGGVINPIVSILSLLILTYISIVIDRNSKKTSENLHLRNKKEDAFDNLAEHLVIIMRVAYKINECYIEMARKIRKGTDKLEKITVVKADEPLTLEEKYKLVGITFEEDINDLKKSKDHLAEFQFFIENFRSRYGHLFKYNFDDKEHQELIDASQKMIDGTNELIESIDNYSIEENENTIEVDGVIQAQMLSKLIVQLKEELM
ncbi:MAG: putative membrane protein [Crocinitomicaceae bacterium]|jgi:uncharacterized membrane protein